MSTTDERARLEFVADPAAAVSRLAGTDRFGEYVIYERAGEWVFAADPVGSVELDARRLRVVDDGVVTETEWSGSPSVVLDAALHTLARGRNVFGWIGFEYCAWALDLTAHVPDNTPLAHMMIPRIEVSVSARGIAVHGATAAEIDDIHQLIAHAPLPDLPDPHPVEIGFDTTDYRHRVTAAVAEIAAGDYQKVILSRRVELPFAVDIPATYRLGRVHNTPARSFLLRLGGVEAAGFSPELVVAVDDDRMVSTQPLAGTRAFGRGAVADTAARDELTSDPKEIAEHAISVQTAFAEIASIAEPGSAVVSEFMTVRERGSVQHLASTVRGRLRTDRSAFDALAILFPSVTAAGIPKRAGIDAVFRHESAPRGLYSGAVVTISPTGALEAALVLRTIFQDAEGAWLRAGAGVVGQSLPDREFEETCEKLSSIAPYVVRAS